MDKKKDDFYFDRDERLAENIRPDFSNTVDKAQIGIETLERYSGTAASEFQEFILLTNFPIYVEKFAQLFDTEVIAGPVLRVSHSKEANISIIDYRVGSPMAALVMDVLSYIKPQAAVMLGLCGGLHRTLKVGELLIPVAAIRDEGTSQYYMPPQVPSLPAFLVQQFISEELFSKDIHFKTGVIHTTDYRMWEFDEGFKKRLREEKASAIDMECSALFSVGFKMKVPVGALMLVSDLPLQPDGIKTKESAQKNFKLYTESHLQTGIDALIRMREATKEKNHEDKLNFRRFHF